MTFEQRGEKITTLAGDNACQVWWGDIHHKSYRPLQGREDTNIYSYLYICQSDLCHVITSISEQVGLSPWVSLRGGSIPNVLSFYLCAVFSLLFVSGRVVSQSSTLRTWYTRYYYLLYDLLFTWHVFIHTECCCRCCCSVPVVLLKQLLLFVIVCRMANNVAGWLNQFPSHVLFLFKHDMFWIYVSLGSAVVFTASTFLFNLGNYEHAGSQGGRQLAEAKPPLYSCIINSGTAVYTCALCLGQQLWDRDKQNKKQVSPIVVLKRTQGSGSSRSVQKQR